jgi:hypothetical protein
MKLQIENRIQAAVYAVIAVGERMLHVREHAPGVGRAPVE